MNSSLGFQPVESKFLYTQVEPVKVQFGCQFFALTLADRGLAGKEVTRCHQDETQKLSAAVCCHGFGHSIAHVVTWLLKDSRIFDRQVS